MPNVNDVYKSNSQLLRVEDLQKKRVAVTIEGASVEQIGDSKKIVLTFEGKDKKLALNKTNARMLEFLTNSGDTDDWLGVRITLRPDLTEYQGKQTPCIRIDSELPVQQPTQQRPTPPPPRRQEWPAEQYDDGQPDF